MEGPVGSRRAVVVLTAFAFALAGCGGDDDDNGSDEAADTVDSGAAVEQDAQAKADGRNLVTLVEVCYVDSQDYTQCVDAAGTEDVGQATVEAPSASEFVVISPSESGNEFRVTKGADGALERSCEEPGEGGCPASGSW
jgi:hypothetical protein